MVAGLASGFAKSRKKKEDVQRKNSAWAYLLTLKLDMFVVLTIFYSLYPTTFFTLDRGRGKRRKRSSMPITSAATSEGLFGPASSSTHTRVLMWRNSSPFFLFLRVSARKIDWTLL